MLRIFSFLLVCSLFLFSPAWAGPGTLLWEDQVNTSNSAATTIVARGHLIFTTGYAAVGPNSYDYMLRVYDGSTGELLWSDSGAGIFSTTAQAGGRVFAAGTNISGPNGTRPGFFMRAYNANKGTFLWQVGNATDVVVGLAATDTTVYVVGWTIPQVEFLIRAYAANTGAVLWENKVPGQGFSIAVGGSRVFTSGRDATNGFLLSAHNAKTGTLLWQHDTPEYLPGLATNGERVFAAGSTGSASYNGHWLVRAYDAPTGTVLWEDIQSNLAPPGICNLPFDNPPIPCNDVALEVDPNAGRLFAMGLSQNEETGGTGVVVRAYQTATGTLLWDDSRLSTLVVPQVIGVHAEGSQAFAIARDGNGYRGSETVPDFWLRAYDAQTGAVNWEEQLTGWSSAFTVKLGRVFVAGSLGPEPESSLLIQAFEAGGIRPLDKYRRVAQDSSP
jgi:hypothetical protein